jgi:hypothetical protein
MSGKSWHEGPDRIESSTITSMVSFQWYEDNSGRAVIVSSLASQSGTDVGVVVAGSIDVEVDAPVSLIGFRGVGATPTESIDVDVVDLGASTPTAL